MASIDSEPGPAAQPGGHRDQSSQRDHAQVRHAYESIAAEYDERMAGQGALDQIFTDTETDFLLSRIRPADEVLDLGCGTGRFTLSLAERASSVTGLDISPRMLAVTRGKLADRGLNADLCEADMTSLPFADGSFDAVVSMLTLMHLPREDRQQAFCEAARVLKPGGRLLIEVKNSVFERLFRGDRFVAVDVTDADAEQIVFTNARGGADLAAPWHSFSPDEIASLSALAGLSLVHLRGNSALCSWLADAVLADDNVRGVVTRLEAALADIPPFSHLGYHLLAEAVKPLR